VYWATKSFRLARFIEKAFRTGGFGVATGAGVSVGVGVAVAVGLGVAVGVGETVGTTATGSELGAAAIVASDVGAPPGSGVHAPAAMATQGERQGPHGSGETRGGSWRSERSMPGIPRHGRRCDTQPQPLGDPRNPVAPSRDAGWRRTIDTTEETHMDKNDPQTQLDQRHLGDRKDKKPGTERQSRDVDEMTQGDRTRPAQPDGTTPLERDQAPVNQKR
jgi:hypothetical protein